MTSEQQQGDILALLSSPATYGGGVDKVDRIDTHISSIFIAGDRAYKLKRAVRLPFLDFSTLEQRYQACQRELLVNRRTAPQLYIGLTAITREDDGRLVLGGEGQAEEWLLVMARFDQDALFDRRAAAGQLSWVDAKALADQIAGFHLSAERQPGWGGEPGIRFTIDTNAICFARAIFGLFDPVTAGRVTEASLAWLIRLAPLLERRRKSGAVRHCHGDLHLGNICLLDGRPTLFDAIEFNEDFAYVDVFYDLAFLLMDLQARGLADLASVVFNRYLERTGDFDAVAALPLFLSLRAAIRAHVSATMAATSGDERQRKDARYYLDMADDYLAPPPPRLVAVGGLSGTGKSRLARDLAPLLGAAPGAVVLRSDVLRKRLMGVDPETRLGADGYTAEMTERTYQGLLDEAERILAAGHSVIADAVFARPDQREAIEAVAQRRDVPFRGLWLDADPDVLRNRVQARRNNASDATAAVLEQQLSYDLGTIGWTRIRSSGTKPQTLKAARHALRL